jgi:hypothetical protein
VGVRRRVLSWMAIYAIALHTILLGVGPLIAAPTVDPFSVICHSEAPAGYSSGARYVSRDISLLGNCCLKLKTRM